MQPRTSKRQAAPFWQMASQLMLLGIALSFWWFSWQGKPTLLDWPLRAIALAVALSALGGLFP